MTKQDFILHIEAEGFKTYGFTGLWKNKENTIRYKLNEFRYFLETSTPEKSSWKQIETRTFAELRINPRTRKISKLRIK
jgi:hypothetical protein